MVYGMLWIDKLEKRFGGWAIPNLTRYLLGLQLIGLALVYGHVAPLEDMLLISGRVMDGEWWRMFSFLMIPPRTHVVFLFFAFYFFYLMGTALEHQWGAFKYNLFILIAYLATVGCAFFVPGGVMSNAFIGGSVFLAFAYLFPDFEILLMFILPVKIKWVALLTWLGFGFALITGSAAVRLAVVASVVNFLIFFGRDIVRSMKAGNRKMVRQTQKIKEATTPFHACAACGASDKTDPTKEFRYCSICGACFCSDHIANHEH